MSHHKMGRRKADRKMLSMSAMEESVPHWALQDGDCFHFLTAGDVDLISFIKFIMRQQHCQYLAVSSWVISGEDVVEIASWYNRGMLDRVDFYVGEIYQGSYVDAYNAAMGLIHKCGGRLAIVRNHMKIVAIVGDRFSALIESSANFNTNPQTENCVITIDRQLVSDVINFLADVVPYNRDTCGAAPYRVTI